MLSEISLNVLLAMQSKDDSMASETGISELLQQLKKGMAMRWSPSRIILRCLVQREHILHCPRSIQSSLRAEGKERKGSYPSSSNSGITSCYILYDFPDDLLIAEIQQFGGTVEIRANYGSR